MALSLILPVYSDINNTWKIRKCQMGLSYSPKPHLNPVSSKKDEFFSCINMHINCAIKHHVLLYPWSRRFWNNQLKNLKDFFYIPYVLFVSKEKLLVISHHYSIIQRYFSFSPSSSGTTEDRTFGDPICGSGYKGINPFVASLHVVIIKIFTYFIGQNVTEHLCCNNLMD